MKQIKGLDTLRAFAVFFVIIAHFGVWFDDTSFSGRLIKDVFIPDGGFGVDLFFVLSGFLITSILFKAKNEYQDVQPLFIIKNFFIRRALRIFPIYYLLLLLLFFVNYPDIKPNIWYCVSYTMNILCYHTNTWNAFSHSWTLDVEEQFYILWPWLVIMVNEKYFKYILIAAIFAGIISTYIGMGVQRHIAPFLVFNCFDAFGIGGLYAWARLKDERCKKIEASLKALVIIALGIYFYWKIGQFLYSQAIYGFYLSKTINSIISLWLIMVVVKNKSVWFGKYFLGNRFLNFIGKISYGIYLYHYVYINGYCGRVNSFLFNVTAKYPRLQARIHDHHVDYWIQVSIIILIAALSYRLIEKPILNLKKRFSYGTPEKSE